MNLTYAYDIALEAARSAGELLRKGLTAVKTIERKSSAVDLLTEYDQAAEALITEHLHSAFPQHRLVAEEGSGAHHPVESPFTWYIDPLDGTNNFAHGLPVFAVSIALYEGDKPQLGIVYDPSRDECFAALAGQGATLTTAGQSRPLQVSATPRLLGSLLATGFPYDRHHTAADNVAQVGAFLKKAQGLRRMGAAALDLAYVAAGRLDGYWEFRLSSWDVAAGILLVQEAGGQVSDMKGRSPTITSRLSLVVSNRHIHQEMLTVLAALPATAS